MMAVEKNSTKRKFKINRFSEQFQMQSMIIPGIIFLFVFNYIPMYGIVIAFKDFQLMSTISGAPWVGLEHFKAFLDDPALGEVVRNTLAINGLSLLFGFPAPIILALLINEIKSSKFKKIIQTISYLPHFLSWVIFGGIVIDILSPGGLVNSLLHSLGLVEENFNVMAQGEHFWLVYTMISIVKSIGFGSILYVAAIAGVDQEMYEASAIDGCSRFQKIMYITLPSIVGTIVIMLIFQISSILNTGYEQILILQNPLNLAFSETLDTYVYKTGITQIRFSYATAVGVLKSVISVGLMLFANFTSKKLLNRGLF